MDNINYYILVTALNFGLVIYLAFFKSYFKEKGKNIDTKEDISKITNEIEKVKKRYNEENELLKTNLNFLLSYKQEENKEIKKAILEFYDAYNNWTFNYLELPFEKIHDNNYSLFLERNLFLDENFRKINIYRERLRLFVDDIKLLNLTEELIKMTRNFSLKLTICMIKIDEQHDLEKKSEKKIQINEAAKDVIKPYIESVSQLYNEFIKEKEDFYLIQAPKVTELISLIRDVFSKLNKEIRN